MIVFAIDPGNTQSAYVAFDGTEIIRAEILPNEEMLEMISDSESWADHMAIEMVASLGMAVGQEVFETVYWTGRFCERSPWPVTRIKRMEVKMNLCHNSRAKDANIRQALIDRIGPQGVKKAPGPTFGLKGDMWSALAVAVTFCDSVVPRPLTP